MGRYRMYVDETGNSGLKRSENFNHRFLGLSGVVFDLNYATTALSPLLQEIKDEYFPSDDPVIFHRKKMVWSEPPFEILKGKEIRIEFYESLLSLISNLDFILISVCIDKRQHLDKYQTWAFDPYHYCLEILMERYTFFLKKQNSVGDLMAEARGGNEDLRLKKAYRGLWLDGNSYIKAEEFQSVLTSRELKLKPKLANIPGLQIADLLAHPSRCEILRDNGIPQGEPPSVQRNLLNILEGKYYQHKGRMYGKKFLG